MPTRNSSQVATTGGFAVSPRVAGIVGSIIGNQTGVRGLGGIASGAVSAYKGNTGAAAQSLVSGVLRAAGAQGALASIAGLAGRYITTGRVTFNQIGSVVLGIAAPQLTLINSIVSALFGVNPLDWLITQVGNFIFGDTVDPATAARVVDEVRGQLFDTADSDQVEAFKQADDAYGGGYDYDASNAGRGLDGPAGDLPADSYTYGGLDGPAGDLPSYTYGGLDGPAGDLPSYTYGGIDGPAGDLPSYTYSWLDGPGGDLDGPARDAGEESDGPAGGAEEGSDDPAPPAEGAFYVGGGPGGIRGVFGIEENNFDYGWTIHEMTGNWVNESGNYGADDGTYGREDLDITRRG